MNCFEEVSLSYLYTWDRSARQTVTQTSLWWNIIQLLIHIMSPHDDSSSGNSSWTIKQLVPSGPSGLLHAFSPYRHESGVKKLMLSVTSIEDGLACFQSRAFSMIPTFHAD